MLLRLAGFAMLMAAAVPAHATNWFFVDSASDGANITFLDKDSFAKDSRGITTAAMYSVMAEPENGVVAYRFTIDVDCAKRVSRLVTGQAFTSASEAEAPLDLGADWEATDPGSQGESIVNFVCNGGTPTGRQAPYGSALPYQKGLSMLTEQRAAKGN